MKTLIARVVRPALFGLICAIPYAVVYAYRFGNVRFPSVGPPTLTAPLGPLEATFACVDTHIHTHTQPHADYAH